MPFTPFHFGPALFLKTAFRTFSFLLFVFSQIVIDLEPLYFMVRDDYPLHRLFHTFAGCNLVIIISVLLGKPLCELWLRISNYLLRLHLKTQISWRAAFVSAAAGAYSHVLLDGFMHRDMEPFWPFVSGNPMLEFRLGAYVAKFCLVCAAAAFLICFLRMDKVRKSNAGH